MFVRITKPKGKLHGSIKLPASKSISNRLLMIRAFSGKEFVIENLSEAADTQLLQTLSAAIHNHLLHGDKEEAITLDCGNAGTVFRFLLPYLANLPGSWILTGSGRMQERPAGSLVNALQQLGASIEYLGKEGFPPVKIQGKKLEGGNVSVEASSSSQFGSALMMLGAFLPSGLKISLVGEVVSRPYLKMTARVMRLFGLKAIFTESQISIAPQHFEAADTFAEPDWSSASYWFEAVCLSEDAEILLQDLRFSGLQGDEAVAGLFYRLGVQCEEVDAGLILRKKNTEETYFTFDFRHNPDLAMTLAVTLAGLGIPGKLSGLKNLAIKESHRLFALKEELLKMGVTLSAGEDELILEGKPIMQANDDIQTYSDHRMAMSFAPLAAVTAALSIHDPRVISKSYPGFWEDLQQAGFGIEFYG